MVLTLNRVYNSHPLSSPTYPYEYSYRVAPTGRPKPMSKSASSLYYDPKNNLEFFLDDPLCDGYYTRPRHYGSLPRSYFSNRNRRQRSRSWAQPDIPPLTSYDDYYGFLPHYQQRRLNCHGRPVYGPWPCSQWNVDEETPRIAAYASSLLVRPFAGGSMSTRTAKKVLSFLESTNASTKKANDSLASYVSETQSNDNLGNWQKSSLCSFAGPEQPSLAFDDVWQPWAQTVSQLPNNLKFNYCDASEAEADYWAAYLKGKVKQQQQQQQQQQHKHMCRHPVVPNWNSTVGATTCCCCHLCCCCCSNVNCRKKCLIPMDWSWRQHPQRSLTYSTGSPSSYYAGVPALDHGSYSTGVPFASQHPYGRSFQRYSYSSTVQPPPLPLRHQPQNYYYWSPDHQPERQQQQRYLDGRRRWKSTNALDTMRDEDYGYDYYDADVCSTSLDRRRKRRLRSSHSLGPPITRSGPRRSRRDPYEDVFSGREELMARTWMEDDDHRKMASPLRRERLQEANFHRYTVPRSRRTNAFISPGVELGDFFLDGGYQNNPLVSSRQKSSSSRMMGGLWGQDHVEDPYYFSHQHQSPLVLDEEKRRSGRGYYYPDGGDPLQNSSRALGSGLYYPLSSDMRYSSYPYRNSSRYTQAFNDPVMVKNTSNNIVRPGWWLQDPELQRDSSYKRSNLLRPSYLLDIGSCHPSANATTASLPNLSTLMSTYDTLSACSQGFLPPATSSLQPSLPNTLWNHQNVALNAASYPHQTSISPGTQTLLAKNPYTHASRVNTGYTGYRVLSPRMPVSNPRVELTTPRPLQNQALQMATKAALSGQFLSPNLSSHLGSQVRMPTSVLCNPKDMAIDKEARINESLYLEHEVKRVRDFYDAQDREYRAFYGDETPAIPKATLLQKMASLRPPPYSVDDIKDLEILAMERLLEEQADAANKAKTTAEESLLSGSEGLFSSKDLRRTSNNYPGSLKTADHLCKSSVLPLLGDLNTAKLSFGLTGHNSNWSNDSIRQPSWMPLTHGAGVNGPLHNSNLRASALNGNSASSSCLNEPSLGSYSGISGLRDPLFTNGSTLGNLTLSRHLLSGTSPNQNSLLGRSRRPTHLVGSSLLGAANNFNYPSTAGSGLQVPADTMLNEDFNRTLSNDFWSSDRLGGPRVTLGSFSDRNIPVAQSSLLSHQHSSRPSNFEDPFLNKIMSAQ